VLISIAVTPILGPRKAGARVVNGARFLPNLDKVFPLTQFVSFILLSLLCADYSVSQNDTRERRTTEVAAQALVELPRTSTQDQPDTNTNPLT
jgi:hypothetical protein